MNSHCSDFSMSEDDPIIQTNEEASLSKRDAVQKGYYTDPYIQYFVKPSERKTPEISRGYYARVYGIKKLLDQFLQIAGAEAQIVNLGAGFDTLFWRLTDEKAKFSSLVEVDLPPVTTRKCYYIRQRKQLLKGLATEDDDVKVSSCDLHAGHYHLVGADLRELDEVETKVIHESGLDVKLPTVFISECVLVYMSTEECNALLSWITRNFRNSVMINYDPVNMEDKFAQVMIDNLKRRNCLLSGIQSCRSIKTQEKRMLSTGWEVCKVWTMTQVYHSINQSELLRVERIELLDEQELLEQLLLHYCISVAHKGGGKMSFKDIGFDVK